MAQAGKGGPPGAPLQPLPLAGPRRAGALRRRPDPSEPLQSSIRPAQALRPPDLPLPPSHAPRVPAHPEPLPQGSGDPLAAPGGAVPLSELVPDAARQHFGGSAAPEAAQQSGVHRFPAAFADDRHRSRDAPRRRQKELQHSVVEAQGEGARAPVRDAPAKRRLDQLNPGKLEHVSTLTHRKSPFNKASLSTTSTRLRQRWQSRKGFDTLTWLS